MAGAQSLDADAPERTEAAARAALEAQPAVRVPAFGELFAAHAAYVLGLLRRLGVPAADVEDVAQEVFIAVHAQLPGFEGRSSIKTWICAIAAHKASSHRRKARVRRELPLLLEEPQAEAVQHARVEAEEQARSLLEALDAMGEKPRQVFVLYDIEELPMREVARIVGCPRFTAYSRLREARSRIRKHLERAMSGEGMR